jgi:hypothetical protein
MNMVKCTLTSSLDLHNFCRGRIEADPRSALLRPSLVKNQNSPLSVEGYLGCQNQLIKARV